MSEGSVLDEFFGPKSSVQHDTGVVKNDWGPCQAGVARMLDHFVAYSLLDPPRSKRELGGWRKGIRVFMEEYGENVELMEKTIRFMKNEGWFITSPFSIIKTARMLNKKGCPECDLDANDCPHEWGSQQRREKYRV